MLARAYPCACSRGTSTTPGAPCASCLARRTPVALPPLAPIDRSGFVRLPRVTPAPPRRCEPMPPVRESYARGHRVEAPCITGCGAVALVRVEGDARGPAPAAGTEGMCLVCRKAENWQRRKVTTGVA